MPANSTGPANDIAPVATADTFAFTAQQVSQVTQTTFQYLDQDPTSPTYGQLLSVVSDVNGITLDVTANDSDANPNDAGHFWIFDLTQPVDAHGHAVGSVSIEQAADGHQVIRFYDPSPNLGVGETVTFTYRAGDQWATQDPSSWANTVSAPVTVTLNVSGNAIKGETLTAPESDWRHHSQPINGDGGNDVVLGSDDRDTLNGNGGDDTIIGAEGKDVLNGGDGDDRIVGGGHVYDRFEQWIRHSDALYTTREGWFGDGCADTINGGAGDDTLTGGGGDDRFVFDYAFGHDVITDFDPRDDKIVVDHNMWGSFADLKAHAQQVGKDVVLTSDFDGYTITLQNTKLWSLYSSDFIFK